MYPAISDNVAMALNPSAIDNPERVNAEQAGACGDKCREAFPKMFQNVPEPRSGLRGPAATRSDPIVLIFRRKSFSAAPNRSRSVGARSYCCAR
jgi:hypothetical protein